MWVRFLLAGPLNTIRSVAQWKSSGLRNQLSGVRISPGRPVKYTMRSPEDIARIKSRIEDPYSVDNFITSEQIAYLIDLFDNHENKIQKNTGPVTVNLDFTDPVVADIVLRLKQLIGPFDITAGFFFTTNYPHIIHNDDTFELPDGVYKGITIPLKTYGSDRVPDLCFFDQFYFHGPAKFFNGDTDIPTYYNKQVYNYADVDGIVGGMIIDESTRCQYFTHLKTQWLKGLTVWGTLKWRPTSALIFDSVRLHCASDFRQQGIARKLGISIFTKVK